MSTNGKTEYYIAQYLREPFRHEARNVGVIVVKGDRAAARFMGESDSGTIDGKKLRWMPNPNIYRHWVESWREEVSELSTSPLGERLMNQNGGNYNVIVGGQVTDTGKDSADDICQFLYASLVGSRSVFAAVEDDDETPVQQFKHDITKEFRKLEIMIGTQGEGVRNPIRTDQHITGKVTSHSPSYTQLNGTLWVMEPVNFAAQYKLRARDHAYYAALMFKDIKAKHRKKARPITIIHGTEEDLQDSVVENAIPLLAESSEQMVFWDRPAEREAFLAERLAIATGPASARD